MSIQLVLCTCPDRDSAERIADALVAEHLAACVAIVPGLTSVYRWKGALQRSEELQLQIKTRSVCLRALEARIVALHPYELPEIVAVQVTDGLPAYLGWVRAQTGPGSD